MEKLKTKEEFKQIRKNLLAGNKKVVLCHGVFDMLHPGHVIHFKEAKSFGDVLVVSITSKEFVRKGPDRPYFNNEQRVAFLEAIEYIDYVLVSEDYTVADIVPVVKPDIYVKGGEYRVESDDVTGKIGEEIALVREYGGDVRFTSGEVFSSTYLINHSMPVYSKEVKEFLKSFSKKYSFNSIREVADRAKDLKVLVVGDVIIDDYIFCAIQGLMSKNTGYSAKFIEEKKYLGGSLAIAGHISALCKNVTLLSVCGKEKDILDEIENGAKNINLKLIKSDTYSTIVKKRYVEPDDRRMELNKIFVINNIPQNSEVPEIDKKAFKETLLEIVSDYDVVFLSDFGHGLIDKEVISIIEKKAKSIALFCQTNSTNYGLNLITKYNRADYFCLNENELRLAFSDYTKNRDELLNCLKEQLGGAGWLTVGSKGAIGIDKAGNKCENPAFVLEVRDTIGAGDAFFAIAGVMAAMGVDINVSTFMGNVAGALVAGTSGNEKSLEYVDVMKYTSTLLNI